MEKMLRFFKKNRIANRVICGVLAMAMVLTMGSFSNWGQTMAKADALRTSPIVVKKANGKYDVTFNVANASASQMRVAGSFTSWASNALNMSSVLGTDGWTVQVTDMEGSDTPYEYKFIADENTWYSDPQNRINPSDAETNSKLLLSEKPVVKEKDNGKFDLTLYYADVAKTATAVEVMGPDLGGNWNPGSSIAMTKTAEGSNIWSYTFTDLTEGSYAYKFCVNALEWVNDPSNSNVDGDNNIVTLSGATQSPVIVKKANGKYDVTFNYSSKTASNVYLAGDMNGWSPTSTPMTKTGDVFSYTLTDQTAGCEYKLIVDGSWTKDPNNMLESGDNSVYVLSESPQVVNKGNGKYDVTFYYADVAKTATSVEVMGTDFGGTWIPGGSIAMTKTAEESNIWSHTFANVSEGSYEYKFCVNASEWKTDPANSNTSGDNSLIVVGANDLGYESPEVNGKSVTFRYKSSTAQSIHVAGSMNGWEENASKASGYKLTKGADDIWELTTTLDSGVYEYKIIVDGSWKTDPANDKMSGGNSKLVVPGLAASEVSALLDTATELPATLDLYAADGGKTSVAVTYEVPSSVASYVTIADGKITVANGFEGTSIALKAKDADNHEATVTVNVVQHLYEYTIYYYDWTEAHRSITATDLWMWEVGGAGGAVEFTGVETLADGRDWLKAVVSVPYTKMGMIARSYGGWDWQTADLMYENKTKADAVTLYLVSNSNKVSTTLPELVEPRDRNVVVEYTRPAKDYTGWNIYSWNTGLSGGTEIYGKEDVIPGVSYMTIPVTDSAADLNLAFCMRHTTEEEEWAAKDGGDHYIMVPADQVVVKAKFVQEQGVTELFPYNKGYEMDAANDRIHFYYRDDALFLTNEEDALVGKIKVVVDGQQYAMAYDEVNERYYYDAVGIEAGDHEYSYIVDGEAVLDSFNKRKNAAGTASVLTYKKFENLEIKAVAYYESMTYNDNNVISVEFTGEDAVNISKEEVAEATVDCSALGTGTLNITPELMAGTIACKFGTSGGVKSLPVTVKDIYGNVYTTTVDVTVAARTKAANDFDWDEAVIYFAVTDRFFDGSTANNAGVDKNGSLSYHGGDFAGLQQKLDYLQDLGINTIWITPIVDNTDVTTDKDGETIESTGYHGYWAGDFTKLNSHLGTEAEFAALIEAAHARGMKLMVDVVINHAGYGDTSNFVVVNEETGETIQMVRDADNTIAGSDVYDSLAGLPDFVTENEYVREQLVEWQVEWIKKYDIDYYRVDTVKHVDTTTWELFKNELIKANQDFKLIGEESGSGYASNSKNHGSAAMDALLDFDFNDFAVAFLSGEISNTEKSLVSRNAAINNTKTLGSFINSHDEDGLQDKLQSQKDMTEEETLELMKVAATLTITAKGIPVIYYGEELGLYGKDNYPYQTNRYDMDWALASKQMANSESIYNHYKKMLAIRKDYTDVFARGTRTTVEASDEKGYDIFARTYGDSKIYVGVNLKDAQKVTIPVTEAAGTVLTDLYTDETYIVDKNQQVKITLPSAKDGGTVVLTADKEVCLVIPVSGTDFTEVVDTINSVADGVKIVVIPADTTVIPKSVFEALKGRDIDVEFQFAASKKNGNLAYSWNVNGKDITELVGDIDLGIVFGTKNIPLKLINALVGNKAYVQFSVNHTGNFGCAMYLDVQLSAKYGSKFGNLYYYNVANEKLDYMQSVKGNDKGLFKGFKFMHASDYVLVLSDEAMDANSTAAPKTGDNFPFVPVAVLFAGSVCVAFAVKRRKAK